MAKETVRSTAKAFRSLANSGYDLTEAIGDIVDNSVDALRKVQRPDDGKNVSVHVEKAPDSDQISRVVIADNGVGMDEDTLREACRYGSEDHNDPSRLGEFGLGLNTAGTSIGPRMTVLSRMDNNSHEFRSWDLDEWDQNQTPEQYDFGHMDQAQEELFKGYVPGNVGTVIIIENINDNQPTAKPARQTLKKNMSRIFRRVMEKEGINIRIGSVELVPGSLESSEILTTSPSNPDGWRHLEDDNGAIVASFRVVHGKGTESRTQGFEWFRNHRSLLTKASYMSPHGLFGKTERWLTSGIFVEVDGDADFYRNFFPDMNFRKTSPTPGEVLKEMLEKQVVPFVDTFVKKKKAKQKINKSADTAKKLEDYAAGLDPNKMSFPDSGGPSSTKKPKKPNVGSGLTKKYTKKRSKKQDEIVFSTVSVGRHGRHFEPAMVSSINASCVRIDIPLNIDHPWVVKNIVNQSNEEATVAALDTIVSEAIVEIGTASQNKKLVDDFLLEKARSLSETVDAQPVYVATPSPTEQEEKVSKAA